MDASKLIYYLDDDTDDLHFFVEMGESLGHKVVPFVNGSLMLKAMGKTPLPDIIFLDILMPVFKGEEILEVIKKADSWKHIPVVMISGTYPKGMAGKYLQSGASYLMKKPSGIEWRENLEHVLEIDWPNFRAYA